MKYLDGAENSPGVFANAVVIDDIQSILFDFWLNTPTYEPGKTVIAFYKEEEVYYDKIASLISKDA